MTKLYIISEIGWDYDDNNYYRSDGVYPSKAFRSKQKAIEELDKMSLQRFKSSFDEISNYGYDNDRFNSNLAQKYKIFEKLFELSLEEWLTKSSNQDFVDWVVEPTEEDWKQLYECCYVDWYSIAEIDVEDSDAEEV